MILPSRSGMIFKVIPALAAGIFLFFCLTGLSAASDSQTTIVAAGLDADPKDDLVIDFGSKYGIWVHYNDRGLNEGWKALHYLSCDSMVSGDLDGNGTSEVIFDFGPQYGIWVYNNNSDWQHLHYLSCDSMVTADLDGDGKDDLIVDFGPNHGIWIYYNNSTWQHLHNLNCVSMVTADLDGNGKDDLIVDFGLSHGICIYYNNAEWQYLHYQNAKHMTKGDIDGNGRDDLIIDFGDPYGIWVYHDSGIWSKLHDISCDSMVAGDLDGNGMDEVIVDLGDQHGVWVNYNNLGWKDGGWKQLHYTSAESMVTADLDCNGKDDCIIDFGPNYGVWVNYNNLGWNDGWRQLHYLSPWAMKCPPPEFTELTDRTAVIGKLLQFKLEASDLNIPEGELTYTATDLPPNAVFDAASRTFSWTPALNDKGTYEVTFTVTNGRTSSSKVVILSTVYIEEARLTNDASVVDKPAIYKEIIVWSDNRNSISDLYTYDIANRTESLINAGTGEKLKPGIYDEKVTYADHSGIYLYDLSTSENNKIASASSNKIGPVIYKDRVVWIEETAPNAIGPAQVYVYDIAKNEVTSMTDIGPGRSSLSIYEDTLFWESTRPGLRFKNIYAYDLISQARSVALNNFSGNGFTVYGDKIIWAQPSGQNNLWLYNITTKEGLQLTDNSGSNNLAMYENRVTWAGEDSQVHLTTMTFSPRIISVEEENDAEGYKLNITGTNFGYSQGSSNIELDGNIVNTFVKSWSDTFICAMPLDSILPGKKILKVNSAGGKSNGVEITLPCIVKAPTVNAFTSPTDEPAQTLSGTKDANTSVWINNVERVLPDNPTDWSVSIMLREGPNSLNVTAKNSAGAESESVLASILLDTTSPTIPVVTDDGAVTAIPDTLHAAWVSQDPDTGITEYQYAIGTLPGGADVVSWTLCGLETQVTKSGLNLASGRTYYFSVRAKNNVGLWSEAGSSDGMTMSQTAPTILSITPVDGSVYEAGSAISFNITADDPEKDAIRYKIVVGEQIVSDWTSESSFNWDTASQSSGSRQAVIYAKDAWGNEASRNIEVYIARRSLDKPQDLE